MPCVVVVVYRTHEPIVILKYFLRMMIKMVIDQGQEITVVLLSLGGGEQKEWVKFEGTVYAPKNATNATIRLFLRWEPGASIEWAQVAFEIVGT